MLKKIVMIGTMLAIVLGFSSMGFSAEEGNYRKGKYTFKKSCRTCHMDGGTAVSLSPDSKTQAQWARVFDSDKYQSLPCKDEWDKVSPEDRQDIFSYLHKFAFDSPSPAKCK